MLQDVTVSDAVVDGDLVFVRLRATVGERVIGTQTAEWLLRYEGRLLRSVVALETVKWDEETAGDDGADGVSSTTRSIVFLSLLHNSAGVIERIRKDIVSFGCERTCAASAWTETTAAIAPEVAAANAANAANAAEQ